MKNKKTTFHLSVTDWSIRLLIALATVLLIVYFLPKRNTFNYDFYLNKPWQYEQLIAKYDFPIEKTLQQIKIERDSALKNFHPYFTKDEKIKEEQIALFRKDFFDGMIHTVPASLLPKITSALSDVYQTGILSVSNYNALNDSNINSFYLIKNQTGKLINKNDFVTTHSAYAQIMQIDTSRVYHNILLTCNIDKYIFPNVILDSLRSKKRYADIYNSIAPTADMVMEGEKIVDRGEIVTQPVYMKLISLKKKSINNVKTQHSVWYTTAGNLIYVSIVIALFIIYLRLYRVEYLEKFSSYCFLITNILGFSLATEYMVQNSFMNIFFLPFALIPIFVRIFMDTRTAFYTLIIILLLSAFAMHKPYDFMVIQIMEGLTAIYLLRQMEQRSQLIIAAILITVTALLANVALDISRDVGLSQMDHWRYIAIATSGFLLLLAYPLMFVIEKLFGFTSSISLIELSNSNNKLLLQMSKEAQGSFNHSIQVANLATEVAFDIGADAQLVRTGALYHDIGKLMSPSYFTENQNGVNPHDQLTEKRSAEIIIDHVTEGLRLAEKNRLPKVIKDIIATHHGKGMVKYFYIQYKNKHPEEEVNKEIFTYPGPNPFTLEQAIIMMCDAVEATSRSLQNYDEEHINDLVNNIIDGQVQDGAFQDCPITFKDITRTKAVLVDALKNIYHARVSYPKLKKEGDNDEEEHTKIKSTLSNSNSFGKFITDGLHNWGHKN